MNDEINISDDKKTVVVQSHRMADPTIPDDLMNGKRFTDPETGQPISIMDVLGKFLVKEERGPEQCQQPNSETKT